MLKLKVEDMTCGHCAAAVQKAVRSVDPAAKVDVDLSAGTVTVETGADEGRIGNAISSAGYSNQALAA